MAVPNAVAMGANYLAREREAEVRSEFIAGHVVMMSGASFTHSLIVGNVYTRMRAMAASRGCRAVTHDLKVYINDLNFYYPDVVVVCATPEFLDTEADTVLNPVVVIEVLSPSTEKRDRSVKLRGYQTVSSIQAIVLISQDEPAAELFERLPDGAWRYSTVIGLSNRLELTLFEGDMSMDDLFDGVPFPSNDEVTELP